MENKKYKILDKDGIEMPHYTGDFIPYVNYDMAKKVLNRLNINGEYKPYILISIRDK